MSTKPCTQSVDVDEAVTSGRLEVASQEDTYLLNGHFEADKMIRFLADALEPAIASGFSGLRVVGEMTWALAGDLGTGPLIEYEAELNYFVRDHPVAVTCQYDRKRFSPEVILNMISHSSHCDLRELRLQQSVLCSARGISSPE
jgi:chemotaxis family two-component system sensor kinase Cph1